jgi:hypothetical protein
MVIASGVTGERDVVLVYVDRHGELAARTLGKAEVVEVPVGENDRLDVGVGSPQTAESRGQGLPRSGQPGGQRANERVFWRGARVSRSGTARKEQAMSVISPKTKGKAGVKAVKAAAKRPQLLWAGTRIAMPAGKAGLKASKPLVKRRARRRVERLDQASRRLGEALSVYAPRAAYDLGLADPPKPKRTTPRVAAGAVLGAGAMYFLEPGEGKKHREKVAQLVS